MDKKTIRHIIHVFFQRIKKYNRQIQTHYAKKPIHLFRVQFKKLRAFLRLLSLETGTPIKLPHGMKKMYRTAGKIRDRQIHQKKFPAPGQGKKDKSWYPSKKEEKHFLSGAQLSSIEKNILKEIPGSLRPETVQTFFIQKQDSIKSLLQKTGKKDEDLHFIRKQLKDLIYIIQVYAEELKQPLPFLFWNKSENKKMETLAHQLGLFNDYCSIHAFLEKQSADETGLEKNKNPLERQQSLDLKNQQRQSVLVQLDQLIPCLLKQPG
jgi:CHAD domain-containing protein